MRGPRLRLFSFPAMLLGAALAIVFFFVYGRLTKPAVPTQLQHLVDQFVSGAEVGATVKSLRPKVKGTLRFVPHLGYVANVASAPSALGEGPQLWLLLDEKDREKRDPAGARVDAVEIVSGARLAYETFSGNAMYLFNKSPERGCLVMDRPGTFRHVSHWAAPRDRGGVVVMTDDVEDGGEVSAGAKVSALLLYAGKFEGSKTLRGTYTPSPCKLVVLGNRGGHTPSAADLALGHYSDSVAGEAPAPAPKPYGIAEYERRSRTGRPPDACADPGWDPEGWHEGRAGQLRVLLPPGFPVASLTGGPGPSYRWVHAASGADLQVFPVFSDRDERVSGKESSSCPTQRKQGMVSIRVGEKKDRPGMLFVSAVFWQGRKPAFAMVATTTDTAQRTMLLHTMHAAVESPVWSLKGK